MTENIISSSCKGAVNIGNLIFINNLPTANEDQIAAKNECLYSTFSPSTISVLQTTKYPTQSPEKNLKNNILSQPYF